MGSRGSCFHTQTRDIDGKVQAGVMAQKCQKKRVSETVVLKGACCGSGEAWLWEGAFHLPRKLRVPPPSYLGLLDSPHIVHAPSAWPPAWPRAWASPWMLRARTAGAAMGPQRAALSPGPHPCQPGTCGAGRSLSMLHGRLPSQAELESIGEMTFLKKPQGDKGPRKCAVSTVWC